MTPLGIDPETVRLVAQCLKHYATLGPIRTSIPSSKVKLKESRNRPGVAQRVPGGLGSQIFITYEGGEVVSLTYRPPLPPGNVLGTHFH